MFWHVASFWSKVVKQIGGRLVARWRSSSLRCISSRLKWPKRFQRRVPRDCSALTSNRGHLYFVPLCRRGHHLTPLFWQHPRSSSSPINIISSNSFHMFLYSIPVKLSRLCSIALLEDFGAVVAVRGHRMTGEEIMELVVSPFQHA